MRELRSQKRRRVSDEDERQDIFSIPSSSSDDEKVDRSSEATPRTPRTRSQSQRGSQKNTEDRTTTDSPSSRANLRSSGRQRKTPKWYEEDTVATPSSSRKKTPATPTTEERERRTTRSTRKPSQFSDRVEINVRQTDSQETPTKRNRPKRATVSFNENDTVNYKEPEPLAGEEEQEEVPASDDDDQEDLDNLVAMQLQQDLVQHDLSRIGNAAERKDPLPEYAEVFENLIREGYYEELRFLARIVLDKLTGKRPVTLKGLENEYHKVHHLIEQTVTAGEGNSMLLFGSRGCGKTSMVESVISSLNKSHGDDFHVVRLNGLFQTDDRLALREMWRQLGRETATEDEVAKVSSYADTMATLLALLSHPEELFGPSSNSETLTAAKSVIIVLDEFDLFVSHPRQTLLYNLFDIAQARKAPVAVIGLTTRVDVTELLEKRVKSRFSHRYVYLPLPRSIEAFSEVCLTALDLSNDEVSEAVGDARDGSRKSKAWKRLLEGWRVYLKGLWNDAEFQPHLRRIYHQTKSVKEFFTSSILPMSNLLHSTYDPDNLQIPTAKDFTTQTLTCPDPAPLPFSTSASNTANNTSLPLSLLLAATRLTAIHDPGNDATMNPQNVGPLTLSFPAAYAEYVQLLTSAKVSASVSGAAATPGRVWGREVALEAWEKLVNWGLVVPVGGGSGVADGRMFRVEVSFEEAVEMVDSGGSLGRWWRS